MKQDAFLCWYMPAQPPHTRTEVLRCIPFESEPAGSKIIHTPQWQFHGLDGSVQVAMGDTSRGMPFSFLSKFVTTTLSKSNDDDRILVR
jgi:hypothetical protein